MDRTGQLWMTDHQITQNHLVHLLTSVVGVAMSEVRTEETVWGQRLIVTLGGVDHSLTRDEVIRLRDALTRELDRRHVIHMLVPVPVAPGIRRRPRK